jgi:SAM-dependent methyltransferase
MSNPKKGAGPRRDGEILHLGCGTKILPGCLNVDRAKLPGVDLVVDLNRFPWPFRSGAWDKVVAHHVVEHLADTPRVLREMHRVLKPGGICELRVPNIAGSDAWNDPTHVRFFTRRSFDYLRRDSANNYYFGFGFEQCLVRNHFGTGRPGRISWLMNPLVNNPLYDYFLWKIIPCAEIRVTLVK